MTDTTPPSLVEQADMTDTPNELVVPDAIDEITRLTTENERLRRQTTDRQYMIDALVQFLGPIALQVWRGWQGKGVQRVHHSWGPGAAALSGEERAAHVLEWENAPKTRIDNEDVVERALKVFNGGIVRVQVPESENARGFIDYYRPKEAMRAAIAALPMRGENQCGLTVKSADAISGEREVVNAMLSKDDAETVLWQAIEAIKIGNKTDDKLILAELRRLGYWLATIEAQP